MDTLFEEGTISFLEEDDVGLMIGLRGLRRRTWGVGVFLFGFGKEGP